MTALQPAVAGDVGDTRIVTLNGVDNLDGVTAIEAHVWNMSNDAVTLQAAVSDSATAAVTVQLGTAGGWLPTAAPGQYFLEIEVSFGSTVLTWPHGSPDTITVRAEGD